MGPRVTRARLRALPATLLTALVAVAAASPATAQRPGGGDPSLSAKAAIVMEASTGDVLFGKRADSRRSVASTTKLMTALVVLQRADLGDVYRASDYRPAPVESQIGLRPGERMTVRDLMRGLLLASGNDAAVTLAEGSMGSVRAFVAEMNRQARRLGLRNTRYGNPIGLDEKGHFSSARDLATLTRALRRYAFFRETVARSRITLRTGDQQRTVVNRNALVREGEANGVKTGRTSKAGYVLVGTRRRGGVTVISAVLGTPSEADRNADSRALLRFGLASYEDRTILPEGRRLGKIGLEYRDGETVDAVAGRSVQRVLRRGSGASVTVVGLPEEVDGPLPRGSRVGTAVVRVGGRVIARVPVNTAQPVAEAGLGTRLGDLAGKPVTLIALTLLLVCSLPLVLLRRRALERRRTLEAERRRARRREETPAG